MKRFFEGVFVGNKGVNGFEGVILAVDLGLFGVSFASGIGGMLKENYGKLERI